ncbi:MAG TPA: monofunctional biosynthetic peptidoglycan transglycosylase [Bacteroidota bacterium]|nr:monofunctional biosynthetic peptidoglycan transglycosylase [Bacteroidota bacterium]
MNHGETEIPSEEQRPPGKAAGVRLWRSFVKRRWFVIAAGLLVVWFVVEMITLPFGAVVRLKKQNPGETAFMREHAAQAKESGRRFRIFQNWIPLSEVPKDVVNAIIVAEDGRFWSHGGFDWFEFRESVERNIREGRAARGASTITQQLVKNLYLSPSKNPLRKLREWVLTLWMEQNLKKSRILEIYLNVIEWGRGIYGIDAASQAYFGKPVQALTREEGARLAAVIPNPKRYGANDDSEYLERRVAIILERMAARGM